MTHPSRPQGQPAFSGASIALFAVAVSSALALQQVFNGATMLLDIIVVIAICHLLLWFVRVSNLPPVPSTIGVIVLCALATAFVTYGPNFVSELPNRLWPDLHEALNTIANQTPPFSSSRGFVFTFGALFSIAGVVADIFAFRRKLLFEALVLHFALFSFLATLGTKSPWLSTFAFMASVLVFSMTHIINIRSGSIAHGTAHRASQAYLKTGLILCAVIIVIVPVVAPLLPGYNHAAVIDIQNLGNSKQDQMPTNGNVVSPDIDRSISLRPQLVTQSNVELFKVQSDQRHYWRQAVLEDYAGGVWNERQSGGSGEALGPPANATTFESHFTIENLSTRYLPTANNPSSISLSDARIDKHTSEITRNSSTKVGLSYNVVALSTSPSADALRAASTKTPSDVLQHDTSTTDLSNADKQLANTITKNASTAYDKALAIETYLRNNYTYDLSVDEPGPGNPLDQFLFDTKRGFCQQFAGSYALLARSVGLPTRIAVGYTPGELESDNQLHVFGTHAHTWPEVYLGEYGWVAFEPTPTRGIPNAAYTNAAEQQVDPSHPDTATTLGSTPTTNANTTVATSPSKQPITKTHRSILKSIVLSVSVIAIVVLCAIAFWWRRRKTRQPSSESAWRTVEHALARQRLIRHEGETKLAFSKRCRNHLDTTAAIDLDHFTRAVEQKTFAAQSRVDEFALNHEAELLAKKIKEMAASRPR